MQPPPPPPAPPAAPLDPHQAVSIPAIILMVISGLGIAWIGFWLVVEIAGVAVGGLTDRSATQYFGKTVSIIILVMSLAFDGLLFYGAYNMKSLKNYTLAVVAAILACIPCYWSCCCVGIPFGIWSIIVLMKPEVKMAFESNRGAPATP
jgi:hypothetical protein